MTKVVYNSNKGHKAIKNKREKYKGSTVIPYPREYSESDIQALVLRQLNESGLNARSEVFSQDLTCRFDIVIFKETLPQAIIEIKKEGKGLSSKQKEKYEKFGIPVYYIFGASDAFDFHKNEIPKLKESRLVNNAQGRVGHRKNKVTEENQPCRKCETPVIKKEGGKTIHKGQKYYFKFYLLCPKCGTMYMQNDQKVFLTQGAK